MSLLITGLKVLLHRAGVVPNSDPCQIITPLGLVGLGLGVGEGLGLGLGLGLGNHIAISTRGVIIWQGVENGHNTGSPACGCEKKIKNIPTLKKQLVDITFEFTSSPTQWCERNTAFTLNQTKITSQSEVVALINTRRA